MSNRYIRGHNRKGVPCSSKHREKISKSLIYKLKEQSHNHSAETKKKISMGVKNHYFTHPEAIEKIRQSLTGRTHSKVHLQNLSRAAKQRFQNETKEQKESRIAKCIAGCHKKPTKLELELDSIICEACPDEYRYVGEGQLIIGG